MFSFVSTAIFILFTNHVHICAFRDGCCYVMSRFAQNRISDAPSANTPPYYNSPGFSDGNWTPGICTKGKPSIHFPNVFLVFLYATSVINSGSIPNICVRMKAKVQLTRLY